MGEIKIYKIHHSVDLTIVGISMQIREFSEDRDNNIALYPGKNDFGLYLPNTVFPLYKMERNAKLTDLVTNVPLGNPLMISHRCLKLFESLHLPEYQTFPLKFTYRGHLNENYVAFNFIRDPSYIDLISWEKSMFYKTQNFHRTRVSECKIHSMEEFMKRRSEFEIDGFGLYPEIRIRYPYEFDIINFNTAPLPSGYLCNEHVKNLILEAELTGFAFEPLPDDTFVDG